MEHIRRAIEGFPNWSHTPIPGISLSAGGLLALADLSTVAQRTAIAGGASWLDSLLLAPGLHYQQAADALARGAGNGGIIGVEERERGHRRVDGGEDVSGEQSGQAGDGSSGASIMINNSATLNYLRRIARAGELVTIDVGAMPMKRARSGLTIFRRRRKSLGQRAAVWTPEEDPDLGRLSHLLYLASPILTVAAMVFTILLQDWWALGFIGALMLSRILNIIVIKARTTPPAAPQPPSEPTPRGQNPTYTTSTSTFQPSSPSSPTHSSPHLPFTNLHTPTNILITLPDGRRCRLRGLPADLTAITTTAFLNATTSIQGYLEAAAKLLVWAAAALSGNATQAGSLCLMGLLLATAALLGLSNAHAKGVRTNGRVAIGELGGKSGKAGSWPGAGTGTGVVNGGGKGKGSAGHANSWPLAGHGQATTNGTNGVMGTSGGARPEGRNGALGVRPVDNWHGGVGVDGDWAETGQAGGQGRPMNDSADYA